MFIQSHEFNIVDTGGEKIGKRGEKSTSRGSMDTRHKRTEPGQVFYVLLFQVRVTHNICTNFALLQRCVNLRGRLYK